MNWYTGAACLLHLPGAACLLHLLASRHALGLPLFSSIRVQEWRQGGPALCYLSTMARLLSPFTVHTMQPCGVTICGCSATQISLLPRKGSRARSRLLRNARNTTLSVLSFPSRLLRSIRLAIFVTNYPSEKDFIVCIVVSYAFVENPRDANAKCYKVVSQVQSGRKGSTRMEIAPCQNRAARQQARDI
jgi:hypothetical protein